MKRGRLKKFKSAIHKSNFYLQEHYYQISNYVENNIKHQRTKFNQMKNENLIENKNKNFFKNVIDIFEQINFIIKIFLKYL